MDQPLNLLDLPVACLIDILKILDSTSRLALFATCKTWKDLVLDSADSTSLQLQPLDLSQQQMLRALKLVHEHARTVAVCMSKHQSRLSSQDDVLLAERSCSLLSLAQSEGYLGRVTSLTLTGAALAVPFLPVFSNSCPNLTALTLQDSNITWEGATEDSFSARFPKLQKLTLLNVTSKEPHPRCQIRLQLQVAQLRGLKSLQLLRDGHNSWGSGHLYYDVASALRPATYGQLTQFALPYNGLYSAPCDWSQLKDLQTLHLQGRLLDDALMQQLLRLPSLISVSVSDIKIKQSYRGQLCCWQQLVISRIRLLSLARLSLHSNLRIKSVPKGSIEVVSRGDTTAACIQEALHNITTSKWGGWKGSHVSLLGLKSNELLVRALALCHGAGGLTLSGEMLINCSMVALRDLVAVQQHGFVLDLVNVRTWDVAELAGVITQLPADSSLHVHGINEAAVIHLCFAARRSLTLHVESMQDVQAGAQERVDASLLQSACTQVIVRTTQVAKGCTGQVSCNWVVMLKCDHIADACHVATAASLQALSHEPDAHGLGLPLVGCLSLGVAYLIWLCARSFSFSFVSGLPLACACGYLLGPLVRSPPV